MDRTTVIPSDFAYNIDDPISFRSYAFSEIDRLIGILCRIIPIKVLKII